MSRIHLEAPSRGPVLIGACGIVGKVSKSRERVTCRVCLRRMPAPVDEGIGVERAVVGGARSLPPDALRIIERSKLGADEAPRARFGSWTALHELHAAVVDDGSPVRSSSDPSRFGARVSTSARPARGVGRDDMIGIDIALERACSDGLVIGGELVAPAEVLAVYLARCEGRPFSGRIAEKRKGRVTRRLECSAADVAEQWGDGHTAHHVAILVREVRRRAMPLLVRMGLLVVGGAKEEADMKVPGFDLIGWKEIANALGVSDDAARRYARLTDAPLPVSTLRVGPRNNVVAKKDEIAAWVVARVAPMTGSAA